jgi:energy-coupling factor transporter ATP-binding protein EcfA2
VSRIIDGIKQYRIIEVGVGEYSFIDREVEVRSIFTSEKGVVLGGWITVLYGPKGCGKSRFFEVLSQITSEIGVDTDIVIVSSEREVWSVERVYTPKTLKDIINYLASSLNINITTDGEVRGYADMVRLVDTISKYVVYRLRRKRDVIIVLDEVGADSPERLSEFRGWLESFANVLRNDASRYWKEFNGSLALIALTSDAMVKEIRFKVGMKVNWVFMWNLPYEAMVRLSRELGLGYDPKILWRLTGGNPRALVRIKINGLRSWFEMEVLKSVQVLLREAGKVLKERLWLGIEKLINNVDDVDPELEKVLLELNIGIFTGGGIPISEVPKEVWIRENYAFQIPAYYYTLKTIHKMRKFDITVNEVLREVEGVD